MMVLPRIDCRAALLETMMPHYKYVVFTEPVAGREGEYNDW